MSGDGRFLTGSTMGHVMRMTATGAVGITFVFIVDAANLLWIAQLDQPRLVAAVGFAYAVQFFSVSVAVGLMIAATAVVSRSIGEGRRDQARRQAGAAVIIAAGILAAVSALIVGLRHPLVAWAGAEGETAQLAARYLAITIPSLIPMSAALVLSGTLRADGYGAKAMYITLLSGIVLLVIDPILIFWMGWGLDGAAIGLVLFRFCLLGLAFYFAVHQMKLVDRPRLRTLRNIAAPFMAVAGPAIATQMSTPAGNYFLTTQMAKFGDEAMAAWAVVGRLTVVVFGGVWYRGDPRLYPRGGGRLCVHRGPVRVQCGVQQSRASGVFDASELAQGWRVQLACGGDAGGCLWRVGRDLWAGAGGGDHGQHRGALGVALCQTLAACCITPP